MKIEIDELVSTKGNGAFWGCVGRRGMKGGEIKFSLSNGNEYKTSLQDIVFYIVHRSEGKGLTNNIKKHEEDN